MNPPPYNTYDVCRWLVGDEIITQYKKPGILKTMDIIRYSDNIMVLDVENLREDWRTLHLV